MSQPLPDPNTLQSWEDAFQYPLAVTRQIEKQLRSEVDGNKQRLRNLVGASYRDLLDTAERISHLDQRMQQTESQLAGISINCNSTLINRKLVELQTARSDVARTQFTKQSQSAQLILLQKSQNVVSRLLKTKSSVLLAAKLLTISRLLHKTLSQSGEYAELLESSRKHIASLRRALLKRIDRHLVFLKLPIERLIEAICAFCLATNSSSLDAVKHFQHVRLEGIKQLLGRKGSEQENVGQAVRFYVQTLRTTRALFGRRLSDAFKYLQDQPLIQGADLLSLDELALDIYGKWTPQEVQNFTRWIKVADLSRSETIAFCKAWSKTAFDRLVKGITSQLQEIDSVDKILTLRKTVLRTWLENWASTPTHGPSSILNVLRKAFNDRVIALSEEKSAALQEVVLQIQQLIQRNDLDSKTPSLWDDDFAASSISHGASAFKEELVNRHLGLTADMLAVKNTFDSWLSDLQNNKSSIAQIGNAKWVDFIEDDEQEDPDLDEDEAEVSDGEPRLTVRSIERLLQKSDVEDLVASQDTGVKRAISSLQNELISTSNLLRSANGETSKDISSSAAKSCLLLRLIRLISQRLLSTFPNSNLTELDQIIPNLHRSISNAVIARLSLDPPKLRKHHSFMRRLWEPMASVLPDTNRKDQQTAAPSSATPLLPTLPSPAIFKFLRTVSHQISSFGPDLWTPSALAILKTALIAELASSQTLREALDLTPPTLPFPSSQNPDQPNGEMTSGDGKTATVADAEKTDDRDDARVQALFNALYLSQALQVPGQGKISPSSSSMTWLIELKDTSDLPQAAMEVLEQRAREYWGRSGLLFGVLTAE